MQRYEEDAQEEHRMELVDEREREIARLVEESGLPEHIVRKSMESSQ